MIPTFSTSSATPIVSRARSFRTVFMIELWERFGFYGMVALLVLYMVQYLGFSDERANLVWGASAALIYAAPALGGWIGDKILGARRTMGLGAVILAIGYLLLAWPTESLVQLYLSMGVIVVGNGFFKPNAANLVRHIYEGDDAKLDSAFTLYYMAVNIGSTFSMLATPWIKEHWGWHAAFAVCGFGLICGILNYWLMRHTLARLGTQPDALPFPWKRFLWVLLGAAVTVCVVMGVLHWEKVALAGVWIAGLSASAMFAYLLSTCAKTERAGLIAVLILTLQTILFFIFYQQMSTSLTLFALRNVDGHFALFGFHLFNWKPAQFQALNPIWVMILSPILAIAYTSLGRFKRDPSIAVKFAMGFAAVAAGFFVYGLSGATAVDGLVSSWFMVAGYGLISLGELFVSALGLAMISRYAPSRMGGLMMGIYYAASGVAQYIGSVVANYANVGATTTNPIETLPRYIHLFNMLGWVGVGGTLLALAFLPLMKRLSGSHSLSST